jgi:hypothetical protein
MIAYTTNSYGNIYFASDTVKGAIPAEMINDAPTELKEKVSKRFTIGPSVERGFWNKERSTIDIDRGPCMFYDFKYNCLSLSAKQL